MINETFEVIEATKAVEAVEVIEATEVLGLLDRFSNAHMLHRVIQILEFSFTLMFEKINILVES